MGRVQKFFKVFGIMLAFFVGFGAVFCGAGTLADWVYQNTKSDAAALYTFFGVLFSAIVAVALAAFTD